MPQPGNVEPEAGATQKLSRIDKAPAVENLIFFFLTCRVVAVVPIFQYTNVYTVTPEFATARDDPTFRSTFATYFHTLLID